MYKQRERGEAREGDEGKKRRGGEEKKNDDNFEVQGTIIC